MGSRALKEGVQQAAAGHIHGVLALQGGAVWEDGKLSAYVVLCSQGKGAGQLSALSAR